MEDVISSSKTLRALQLLQTYLSSIDTRVEVMKMESNVPMSMEVAIGTVMATRGHVNVPELDDVGLSE